MTHLKTLVMAGLVLACGVAQAAPAALYTSAQATAGADVYTQSCALCHGDALQGVAAPGLKGQAFAPAGKGYTIGSVFAQISSQMPDNAPGSLSNTQYEDVMAYLLAQNGYPAGTTALDFKSSLASTQPFVSQVP